MHNVPPPLKYAPGCACRNGLSILIQLEPIHQVFSKSVVCLCWFFIKSFISNKIYNLCMFRLVLRRHLVARKESLTGVSTSLTGRSKNLNQSDR